MSTIRIEGNYGYVDEYPCECDNCGKELMSSELEPIRDAEQRLTPGAETPAGECPDCYALCYVVKPDEQAA